MGGGQTVLAFAAAGISRRGGPLPPPIAPRRRLPRARLRSRLRRQSPRPHFRQQTSPRNQPRASRMGAPTHQFREEMAIYDVVDDFYNSEEALGRTASQAMLCLSARASHHEFPYGMSILAHLCACTNGAVTQVFPGDPSPVSLPMVNLNFPQTRKSSGHRAGLSVGAAIDKHVLGVAKEEVKRRPREEEAGPVVGEALARTVKVESSMLTSFTEAAFFQRCSGDWNQVAPSELHGLSGRVYFGTLMNLDEAYRFLKMVGLVPAQNGKGRAGGKTRGFRRCHRLW